MKLHSMFFAAAFSLALVSGCESVPVDDVDAGPVPVRIASAVTKVSGERFEEGDAVGIFAVNAAGTDGDWTPGVFAPGGNHLDNVKFKLSGTVWAAEREYYWKDDRTPAEFYCYFPYRQTVGSAGELSFEIPSDQSSAAAFKSAEILWGKTSLTDPTEECVLINTTHRMSQIAVSVVPGKGYTEETLREELESVRINSLKCGAVLNLSDGSLTAAGEQKDIIPYRDNGIWRAMVVPQTVTDRVLVTLVVNGMERKLTASIDFTSNSRKKCTLTINRISEGVNVGIGGWEDDDTDYGGVLN